MKRILVLLLALTLILSVAACGKKVDGGQDSITESSLNTTDTSDATEESAADTTEETTDSTGSTDTTETTDTTESTDETEPGGVTDENTEPDTPAPPHTHEYRSAVTTQPGCESEGVKTFTCSCGDSYTKTVAAIGHSYADGTCANCGEADPDYVAPGAEIPAGTNILSITDVTEFKDDFLRKRGR